MARKKATKNLSTRDMDILADGVWLYLDSLTLKDILSKEKELLRTIEQMLSPLSPEDLSRYMEGIGELIAMKKVAFEHSERLDSKLSEPIEVKKPLAEELGYLQHARKSCDSCIYFGYPNPLQCFNPKRKSRVRYASQCRLYRKGISVDRMLLIELRYDGPGLRTWKDYIEFLKSLHLRREDLLWSSRPEGAP